MIEQALSIVSDSLTTFKCSPFKARTDVFKVSVSTFLLRSSSLKVYSQKGKTDMLFKRWWTGNLPIRVGRHIKMKKEKS